MKVEQVRPTIATITLHTFELAALMASARWIVEGCPGELPGDAVDQLRGVVAGYDAALAKGSPAGPADRTPGAGVIV